MRWLRMRYLLLPLLLLAGLAHAGIDFSLPDVEGKPRSLSEFRGKWVVVNYWATWCPPCLEEIPDLVDFHERHKDGDAVVLGINYEDIDPRRLRAFIEEYFISYPVLVSSDMAPPHPDMPVGGLPTTYIISPEGELVARQVGTVTAELLEKYLARKQQERAGAEGK
ncbi:TlpA disulfide reductase family protein [Thiohalobacter sp.]|uniref:TlpA disulfide reductase family protein n=1 Tax=Thiohalobacter sp. TaxID=2025948 RepID=UPI00260AE082|nr:TlpA disulfide reductase family protein [Thiohalobacter sp.]